MSSVEQLGTDRWRARWRDPGGRQKAKTFTQKDFADHYLRNINAAIQMRTYVDPSLGCVKVKDFAAKWMSAQGHLKPSTRATYESILSKHVFPRWGSTPLLKVAHEDVAVWVSGLLESGLTPATVRYVHRVFSLLLDLAVRSSRIPRNPATGVRLPRVQMAEKRFLSHQEVNALAQASGDYRVAVLLLSYCGLRWGELAALKVSRVDLPRHRLDVAEAVSEVRGKLIWGTPTSHQARSVPIPGFLVDDLTVAMAGKAPDALIFVSRRGAVLRNLNFRRDVFDPAATAVGLDGLTPHELRHTAVSLAVSAGANVKAVQRMLGHASAALTLDVYSGLFEDDLDGVAERLDAGAVNAGAGARVYSMCTETPILPLTAESAGR